MLPTDATYKAIGANIRAARERRGWSQPQLAEALLSDNSFVSMLETGRTGKTLASLMRVADALQVAVVDLLPAECHQHMDVWEEKSV